MKLTRLLKNLDTLQFKTNSELAAASGLTIDEVSESISALQSLGVPIVASNSRGFKLSRSIDVLNRPKMQSALLKIDPLIASRIEVLEQVDSTNSYLLDYPRRTHLHKKLCIAEYMTAGRGRRGRNWHGGAFENIMMSIAWDFESKRNLSGLSLAIAVIAARALETSLGISVQVKWPNDILFNHRKLGGILIEIQDSVAVIGLGLNCRLNEAETESIGQPVISISDIAETAVDRSQLITAITIFLIDGLHEFERCGFNPFKFEWLKRHAFAAQRVHIDGRPSVSGTVVGVNDDGALLLKKIDGEIAAIHAGEVRLIRRTTSR